MEFPDVGKSRILGPDELHVGFLLLAPSEGLQSFLISTVHVENPREELQYEVKYSRGYSLVDLLVNFQRSLAEGREPGVGLC